MHRAIGPRSLAVLLAGALSSPSAAQAPDKIAGLGSLLFSSPALSSSREVSCATCHDATKSFADGRAEAEGQMKVAVGRNTPTLLAIGAIARFRDPRQAQTAKPGRAPRVLSLEERCLEPLANDLEMGSGVESAVLALRKDAAISKRFDETFGGQEGVTKPRLAQALAAFVRTLSAPKSPYADHLAGTTSALTPSQARGLAVFESHGCAECHSGPALSDGMMHVVDPPWGQRMLDRQRTASERRIELLRRDYARHNSVDEVTRMSRDSMAREAKLRANALPGGGGYDPDQIEVQTTTLWDVKRTAPYFRDGSVPSLGDAVRTHIREMKVVRDEEARVKKDLAALDRAGKRSPTALRPVRKTERAFGREPPPAEFQDLIEFLNALSPG
jgi:cytochrome c peroxidase